MRERVRELGGRFNIEGGPQGSVVSVSLPIGWEAGQQAVAV
jgi:signal transduction histidine kinase